PVGNYQIGSYSHLQSYYNNIKPWLENVTSVSLTASPWRVDYLGSVTLDWSASNASACSATTSDGWSGTVATAGSVTLTMNQTTTYTINCSGAGGQASQSLKVEVNPPTWDAVECLFNWAEATYPDLLRRDFIQITQFSNPYRYRYYSATKSYAGVSDDSNHVYYKGPGGVLEDLGPASVWLAKSACQ
ncbi:MAG: hypothetical protein ACOYMG_23805, partial [Candidatus Methylumidiphilus sp.]